jgi:membrane protein implicated in regulation of membrane protease activity
MPDLGRTLVVIGLVVVAIGLVIMLAGRVPWLGRLPGDIHVQRENWSFYFPLTTSILVSVVLSLLLYLFGRR